MVVFGDKQKVKDSFQIAGTSLDISSKIYGIRVDDVYTNSLSLAGNMARAKNRDSNGTLFYFLNQYKLIDLTFFRCK